MKKKILVIDDELDVSGLLKIRLEANNFDVATAADGEEGLEKAEQERPDLIILDVMMPKMDGYTFVREIRTYEHLRQIPIIILTAKEGMKDLFAIEGVCDYVNKPYEIDDLLKKIHKNMKKDGA